MADSITATKDAPKTEIPVEKKTQTAVIITTSSNYGRQGEYTYVDADIAQGLIDNHFAKKPTKELLEKLGYTEAQVKSIDDKNK